MKREHWMIGATVGLMAFAAYLLMGGGSSPGGHGTHPAGWPDRFAFQCTACDHRWDEKSQQMLGQRFGGMPAHEKAVECASCAKKSAYWLNACPWCREPYLAKFQSEPGQAATAENCPHCGKDVWDWKP